MSRKAKPVDMKAGLARLDAIAVAEYGTSFAQAIQTNDEELTVRRIARMAGIELKHPFATPERIEGKSETGARQQWLFNAQLLERGMDGKANLDALEGDPSYELVKRVYDELKGQGDERTKALDFGNFLRDNHSESNWFLSLLKAAQPYLCENADRNALSPPTSKTRREFWEAVRVAAGGATEKGLEFALAALGTPLVSLVPWLNQAPNAVIAGVSVFLVHYAKRGYCSLEIQEEIVLTLKWRSNEWERR